MVNSQKPVVETYDVVVVGGGGSGLAAAVEASSIGRSVVLIEKNEVLGGTTARSIGSISATNTPHQLRLGITDNPIHHYEDLEKFNAKLLLKNNEALARFLTENVPDTLRWLMEMGVEFFGPMVELPHRKPRMHNIIPNSRAYIYHLSRRARRNGVHVKTSTQAQEFLLDGDRVKGVRCQTPSGEIELHARGGIVLCSGDYSANREMRSEYISDVIGRITPVNPTNTGDGHRMVVEKGGHVVNPHLYLSGLRFSPPKRNWFSLLPPQRFITRPLNLGLRHLPSWILHPILMRFLTTVLVPSPKLLAEGGILVNEKGERFTDETGEIAADLLDQPNQKAFIILDGRLVDKFSKWPYYVSTAPGFSYAFLDDYRRTRRDLFRRGASLGQMAGSMGVPTDALHRTIETYNERVRRKELDRPAFGDGPYVALGPVVYMINFTDGGVAVNDRLQVVRKDGSVIEGLYAAGFAGMGGVLLEGHGHHLGWAFTSGRFAGRRAAHNVVSKDVSPTVESPAGFLGRHS